MKKFLSLVLALVMTMSLVTVSAGAKDFNDSDDLSGEQYEEAVNVMSEMGIIDGYAGGNFQPQGTLTRGAAAKIIACMMLGKTTAEALGTSAAPFKDVPAGSTFAGYIAYCVESGLIDGYADGTFRPQNTLTGFAFLKMLLTALGYDSAIEGYTGTNWTVNVAGRATQIGLTDGNEDFVGSRAATREEACLYAVNALKTTLVEYESKGTNVTVNGATVAIGASKPTFVTSSIAGAATSIDDTIDNTTHDYTVEFAEKYQPDLELDPDTDPFGRPSHTWSWKGDKIGTYVDFDLMVAEYTTSVTGRELYDVLGSRVVDDYDVDIYFDGETDEDVVSHNNFFVLGDINRNNRGNLPSTGDGVLTQVFVDPNAGSDGEATIAIINTYLAKATDDYDDRSETLDLNVYGIDEYSNSGAYFKEVVDGQEDVEPFDVEGEDFDVADVVEGDFFLVTVADGEIQTMADAEVLSGVEVSGFSLGSYVTVDGTKYDYADTAEYKHGDLDAYNDLNLKDVTYNVYLDSYGYLIGIEVVEEVNNYVFITGIDNNASNLGNRQADANAIFLDGSMSTIKVDLTRGTPGTLRTKDNKATINSWFTYTVNSSNVYTLTEVGDGDNGTIGQVHYNGADNTTTWTINDEHYSMPANANDGDDRYIYSDDESVYILGEVEFINNFGGDQSIIIDDVDTVVTGIDNVNMVSYSAWYVNNEYGPVNDGGTYAEDISYGVYALYDDEARVIGAIVIGEDQGTTKNLVYVHTSNMDREENKEDRDYLWTREVIYNGQEIEIQELADRPEYIGNLSVGQGVVTGTGTWYQVSYDANGYVRKMVPVATALGANYVTDITDVEGRIQAGADTILYQDDLTTKPNLGSGNRTLYTSTQDHDGIRVAADVNIVLSQENNNKRTEIYETGRDQLDEIIDDLHIDAFNAYDYNMSAVIENGQATTIIFFDDNDDGYVNPGHGMNAQTKYDAQLTPTVDQFGNIGFSSFTQADGTSFNNWVLDNAYVNYTVIVNGEKYTSTQTLGNVTFNAATLANMKVPGLTVANGSNITVTAELIWTNHNDGTTICSATGTGRIF